MKRVALLIYGLTAGVCCATASVHQDHLREFGNGSPGGFCHHVVTGGMPSRTARLVYGWYPYWQGSSYERFRWSCLSHVSFFGLDMDATGAITNYHGWPGSWTGLIDSAAAHNVKMTVTVMLFDSSDINDLINSQANRNRAVNGLVDAMMAGGAQGINIDFEGSNLHPQNLVLFTQELKTAMDAVMPGSHLSMATPSVDWTGCWDYDQLAAACDALIPMCYGYHWGGGPPGPVSPLTAGGIWSHWCVTETIADYLDPDHGIPPSRLAPGFPYYGIDWEVTGDPAQVPASGYTGNSGSHSYTYIRYNHDSYRKYWDTHSQGPWYHYSDQQVWYDDENSLALKYNLVLDLDLAGIGIWALGYDDGWQELWDLLETYFVNPDVTPTSVPTRIPTTTPALSPTPHGTASYELRLSQDMFQAGDPFRLEREAFNPGPTRVVQEWLVLDIQGCYWFYPNWTVRPGGLELLLPPGVNCALPLDFTWPAGDFGTLSDIVFWGAMLEPVSATLFTNIAQARFGYR
ncbi:hypothetical protein JW905_02895 [bacterium]|nr:hypothetical protein [candidate division CSSED10-310 bacterium]